MRRATLAASWLTLLAAAHAQIGLWLAATDARVAWTGRTLAFANGSVQYDWSGVSAALTVNASAVLVVLRDQTPRPLPTARFAVAVGGVGGQAFASDPAVSLYVLATALTAPTVVSFTRLTEPAFNAGNTTLRGVVVDGFWLVGAGAPAVLPPPPAPARALEFVGDSQTAGFGAAGSPPCAATQWNEDWLLTFDALLCASFGAACHVAAWSGRGLVANYPAEEPSTHMPQLYAQTLGSGPSPWAGAGQGWSNAWAWAAWRPSAVVVALGGNDFCCGERPQLADYASTYLALLRNISFVYYPPAPTPMPIVVVQGPMPSAMEAQWAGNVSAVLTQARAEGMSVVLANVTGVLANATTFGCLGHPSAVGHLATAEALAPVLAELLGWVPEAPLASQCTVA
jgi:lysophospholipase L1-like esterase